MKNQQKAYVYATATILLWSTIASAFKFTLQHIGFLNLLFYGSITATLIFLTSLLIRKKTRELLSVDWKFLLHSALRGFLNPFLYYLVLLRAYELLKAQEAGTLNYIWPVTLVLLSIPFLKQKIGWLSIVAILISFTGIVVISTEGRIASLQFREPVGVALAAGSSIFWSLYWILNMKDERDEQLKLFYNFLFGTLFIFLSLLYTDGFERPTFYGLAGAIYAGFFEMGITFFLWLKALKLSTHTARVANLIYISPFISLIIINFTLGEKILWATVAGLVLIVAGIFLQHFAGKTAERKIAEDQR